MSGHPNHIANKESMAYNPLFDADIKATLKRYPALGIVKHGKERYLKGILDICNKEKEQTRFGLFL